MSSSSLATILFTDIVDSTGQRSRIGDDAADAVVAGHDSIVQAAADTHGGRIIKTLGDGALAEFPSAIEAIEAGLEICAAATEHAQSHEHSFEVRVGVHAGEISRTNGDVSGLPVAVAARVCALARGGQVLVTDVVRSLVGSRGQISLTSIGSRELKGVSGAVDIWSVSYEAVDDDVVARRDSVPFPAFLERGTPDRLVGRSREMDLLKGAYTAAHGGEPALVAIVGEPGIGKTALTSSWASQAAQGGATVVGGRCTPDAAVPFQPFIEIAKAVLDARPGAIESLGPAAGNVAMLVPGAAHGVRVPPPIDADVETTQYLMAEAFAALVRPDDEGPPSVVVLDDLHWADDSSLAVVSHLARSDSESRTVIVGTYRDTDLIRSHPLSRLLSELRRETRIQRMKLDPLDHDEVGAMIASQAGADIDSEVVDSILTETKGNPFFVTEMVAHLREEGAIDEQGRWTSEIPVEQYGIPEGVRDLIGLRIERLSDDAVAFLQAGAVIGPTVPVDIAAELAELDEQQVDDVIDTAVAAGLLEEGDSFDEVVFAHALVRQTLYDELSMRRRLRLHRLVAEALESSGAPAVAVLQHALAVDDTRKALRLAVKASDDAIKASSPRLAMENLELALDLWADVDDPEEASGTTHAMLVVDLSSFWSDFGIELDRAIMLVQQELTDGSADAQTSALLHLRLSDHVWLAGDIKRSTEQIQAALELIEGDVSPNVRGRVLAVNAGRLMTAGHYEEAIVFGHSALEAISDIDEPRVARPAYGALATSYGAMGDLEQSELWFDRLVAHSKQTGNVRALLLRSMNQGEVYRLNREHQAAIDSFEHGVVVASEIGARRWVVAFKANTAEVLLITGRWDEAEALLAGIPDYEDLDFPELTLIPRRMTLAAGRGDDEEYLRSAARLADVDLPSQEAQVNAPIWTAMLLRHGLRREYAEAFALAQVAAESWADLELWIEAASPISIAIGIVADAAGAGVAEQEWIEAAGRWHDRLQASAGAGPFLEVFKKTASAELARISGADTPDQWRQALDAAVELPYVQATLQHKLALALEAAGNHEEAAELRSAALATAERLGAEPLRLAIIADQPRPT